MSAPAVLVTGAAGYLGSQVVAALATGLIPVRRVVAVDLRAAPPGQRHPGVEHLVADIRSPEFLALFEPGGIDVVVHLAAIVTPPRGMTREELHAVEVGGTGRVLEACRQGAVRQLIVTSSGAAYGYHPGQPDWIAEDWPLRGNEEFAYAHHKRLVEELLARWRRDEPTLRQVVFRVGTILGDTVRNQITDLFDRRVLLAIRGSSSPFVFVWDQDVAGAILHAIATGQEGVFNLAGDGALTMRELAHRMGKRCLELPAGLVRAVLAVLHPLGLSPYGPEQVDFLRYRPVLDNTRLKEQFGYRPRLTTAQVFEHYLEARRAAGTARPPTGAPEAGP